MTWRDCPPTMTLSPRGEPTLLRGGAGDQDQPVLDGSRLVWIGTDTAPHTVDTKECACGCAGIFNAPVALQVYAQVFAEEDALI